MENGLWRGAEPQSSGVEKDTVSQSPENEGDLIGDPAQELPSDLLPLIQQLASLPAKTRSSLAAVLKTLLQLPTDLED
jgi:hypothetical protein